MPRPLYAILLTFALAATSRGDEPNTHIHFREKAQVASRVVYLADVADIDSGDAALVEKLGKTELIAAPSLGQVRSLRQRELIDHVQLNGFNLQQIEFSGAAITQVSMGSTKALKPASASAGRLSAAQRRIKQVVVTYLRAAEPEARRAEINVECDQACATAASVTAATVSVVSAEPSGAEGYEVIVAINSRGVVEEYTLQATVTQSNRVVLAARPLKSGAILTAADLKLGAPKSEVDQASSVSAIEDLVGRELTRSVGTDQVVPYDQVAQPRMIRKGDLVEVTVKSAGIRITTQAIAQQDGAQGDTIALEPIDTKQKVGQKNKETIIAKVAAHGQAQIDVAGRALPAPRIGSEPARLGAAASRLQRR